MPILSSPDGPRARVAETALILAAHGSSRRAEAAAHVEGLARAAQERFGFASAQTLFLVADPTDAPPRLDGAARAVVVPLMMSDGQLAEDAVLRVMPGAVPIVRAEPVGLRPEIAGLAAAMAARAASDRGWLTADTNVVLVAHGSGSRPESRRNGELHVGRIRTLHRFRSVKLALLEETPTIRDALGAVEGPAAVVGLFAAPGGHAIDDVPVEIRASGHKDAVYAGPVGLDPGMVELIGASALAALV